MKRVQNWEHVLSDALDASCSLPFAWGQHDCAIFALSVARDLTNDATLAGHIARYAGTYDTVATARYTLLSIGVPTVAALADLWIGGVIPWKLAQRGDLVAVDQARVGLTLGICIGRSTFASVGQLGADYLPMSRAVRAWRVG